MLFLGSLNLSTGLPLMLAKKCFYFFLNLLSAFQGMPFFKITFFDYLVIFKGTNIRTMVYKLECIFLLGIFVLFFTSYYIEPTAACLLARSLGFRLLSIRMCCVSCAGFQKLSVYPSP